MIERVLNTLNSVRAIGGAILGVAIATAAFKAGGWQGELVGGVFVLFAVSMIVAGVRPRYRSPSE